MTQFFVTCGQGRSFLGECIGSDLSPYTQLNKLLQRELQDFVHVQKVKFDFLGPNIYK